MTLFKNSEEIPTDVQFRLPIEYLSKEKNHYLEPNIVSDLELCEGTGIWAEEDMKPMYSCITSGVSYNKLTSATRGLHNRLAVKYTTDVNFLHESGEIIDKIGISKKESSNAVTAMPEEIYKQMEDLKGDANFLENYYYMEWEMFKNLNKSAPFLQTLYTMNMLSPILTLLSPLSVFITPFFILQFTSRFTGNTITWDIYWSIVRSLIKELAIVKLFYISPSKQSLRDILTTLLYAIIYIYTSYQNTIACINFHKKVAQVHKFIADIRNFIASSQADVRWWLDNVPDVPTHSPFRESLKRHQGTMCNLSDKLNTVPMKWTLFDFKAVSQIGQTMAIFYEMRHDDTWFWTIKYASEFNTYMTFMRELGQKHAEGKLTKAIIKDDKLDTGKGIKFIKNYYAPLAVNMDSPVKNTVVMRDKNLIISGPNASGKTTYMKSVLLNIIFTQQFGIGCYGAGSSLKPFCHLHCYLNIPDTSGRDSLFQAEARRCKNILDIIKGDSRRHFIIFDELFSGTNPEEAVKSSTGFIKYLSKIPQVVFMLTTHYRAVCKKAANGCENIQMAVKKRDDGGLQYTYRATPGISKVKGGEFVLKELGYPIEVTNNE